jgi:hypothetical protein
VLQHTTIGENQSPEVSSLSSSVSSHPQEEQTKHGDIGIYTNVDGLPLLSRGPVNPIHPSVNPIICKLMQWYLEFLTIEVSLVCHVPFSKQHWKCKMSDSSNATINEKIPCLGASVFVCDERNRVGDLSDMLPHFIIYPLYCQASLIPPIPKSLDIPSSDSNTGNCGADPNLKSQHLDYISICKD